MNTPYELDEHRHRFAVWAAARAAQRGLNGFTVEAAARGIELCGLRAVAGDWRRLPMPMEFDAQHDDWRERVCSVIPGCSHGRAAKLINIYLKLVVICGPAGADAEASERVDAIHPPIDRRLLKGLASCSADEGPGRQLAGLAGKSWTSFDGPTYREVIDAVRAWLRHRNEGESLWRAEACWKPH